MSTPGNFANGNTDSFTDTHRGTGSSVIPWSASVRPTITRAAACARFNPVAFETNGTVRDARGFTSRT